MKSKTRFIPLVFLGAIILSLIVIVPAFSATGAVRFYDVNDTDEDQEWARQGGMVAVEVEDSDLDVVSKRVDTPSQTAVDCDNCVMAEMVTLAAERTFYLESVPVADSGVADNNVVDGDTDGFVNSRDIRLVDMDGNNVTSPQVDRLGVDGRVDLVAAHTGTFYAVYWGEDEGDTGDSVTAKSQADPTGITVTLMETSADSGVFRGMITTSEDDSDEASMTLKVGKNDVITVTYNDEDPDRNTSKTLKVETTAPIIANPMPAHDAADRADPDIQFDVTDSDSGIADEDDIWVIFAVDANADGVIDDGGEYKYQVDEASKGDVDEEDGIFSAKQGLPSDVEIDNDATVFWWALAQDSAGNLAITDRKSTIEVDDEDVDDPCTVSDFPDGVLAGQDVNATSEIGGCQPYAVRIDNTEPSVNSATTGPTWDADDDEVDMDAGEATSVLVVFSEDVDADTAESSDFTVEGASVTEVEVQGENVFLTLSSDLAPDEEPDVELVGSVRDIAGNRQTSGEVEATDGIAPTLTVEVVGGNRSVTNGNITIKISSNEDVGTPKVMFSRVVDSARDDDDDTDDVDEAMYALEMVDEEDGVLKSARNYEVSYEAPDPGLYNVYIMANDATESNTGTEGVNEGPIDLDDDTDAILFEFDEAVGKPTVMPDDEEGTDSSDPFITIDFSAEGTEYADNEGVDLDSHGTVTITSASLKSPDMDAMDITDSLVTTDDMVFLYKASDLSKGDHVITVSAMDTAGNELEDEELTVLVEERAPFKLELKPGWNLVSLPGTPTNTSINAVIPADHPASTILTYDAGAGWLTAIRSGDGTWLGTLMTIDATRAYWVQTDSFEAIEVDIPRISAGTSVPPTIALSAGWNFVPVIDVTGDMGHGDEVPASAYFSGVDINRVYTFDTLMGMWDVVDVEDGSLMVGSGYWVHADEDDVLAP